MKDKKTIRKQMKDVLKDISKPLYEDYSYQIAQHLYEDEDWKEANVIGVTVSNPPEVDTYQIIRKAWEQGKAVAVPKCHPKDKQLVFHLLTEFNQLESVFFGLLEPMEERTPIIHPNNIDLLLVPGLAYRSSGYRLGFGGGYYDRFLTSYEGKTISLAFTEQMIENFPIDEYDLPVNKIITNERVIVTKQ